MKKRDLILIKIMAAFLGADLGVIIAKILDHAYF